jgi:hypothetical protein
MTEPAEIINRPAVTSFRGRPYTKAVPFARVFAGAVPNETQEVWRVVGAFFELGLLLAASTAAGRYAVCDTVAENIIGYIQFDGVNFSRFDLGMAAIRSNRLANATLILLSPVAIAATIVGVAYGWEVTQEGNYR